MRVLLRVRLAVAAAVAVLVSPQPVHADLFGGDVAELAAILTETVSQGSTLTQQLTRLSDQITLMRQALSTLDPASYASILNLVNRSELDYSQLVSNVNSVGYTLSSVNADFQQAFPTDFSSTSMPNIGALYGKWQNEIWDSTLVAARTQSVLSTLRDNTNNAAMILSSSQSAEGTVAQLQAVVQMLGVMQSQTNSLLQSLATTGRVVATTAAASASDRQLSLEKKRRNLAGYTSRGRQVNVRTKLP